VEVNAKRRERREEVARELEWVRREKRGRSGAA
jgi:hypothetical protein